MTMDEYRDGLIKSFNNGYKTAKEEANSLIYEEQENLTVGGLLDITNDPADWYEIRLGDDVLYIDTATGKDGKEHFNLVELTENGITAQLMTEMEWRDGI